MDGKAAEEQINDYISHNPDALTKKTLKIQYKGEYVDFPIYRLPINLLRFRLENTRFEFQKLQDEKDNGPIDQDTPEGEQRIIKLLLGKPPTSDAKELIESIKKDGQVKDGVISHDGAVIDGNRRLASLKTLFENTSADKYSYFTTARIPKSADEKDIFKIEAHLQWAKDYKVDYDPLNNYMMLKKAKEFHMTDKQIAELTNREEEKVRESKAELDLIDNYLESRGKSDSYYMIEGQTEVFTDATKEVKSLKDKREVDKLAKYKKIVFNFADINLKEKKTITYEHIRKLNGAFNQDDDEVIAIFEGIKPTDSVNEVKTALATATQHLEISKFFGKPEKLAQQVKDFAIKLSKENGRQRFTDETKKIINETIRILEGLK